MVQMLFSCDAKRSEVIEMLCTYFKYYKFTKEVHITKGVALYLIFIVCKADCFFP